MSQNRKKKNDKNRQNNNNNSNDETTKVLKCKSEIGKIQSDLEHKQLEYITFMKESETELKFLEKKLELERSEGKSQLEMLNNKVKGLFNNYFSIIILT